MKGTAFEILELPSRPFLNLELLESNLRRLSARYHPDQKTGNADFFEQLQKAAATLRRPSSRLRLLADTRLLSKPAPVDEVTGASGAQQRSVVKLVNAAIIEATPQCSAEVEFQKKSAQEKIPFPSAAADLFQTIASALEKSKRLLASHHAAFGVLSKALLMPSLLAAHTELLTAQQHLQTWEQTLNNKLQSLDVCWPNVDKTELLSLANSFIFAERWTDQLRETLLKMKLILENKAH